MLRKCHILVQGSKSAGGLPSRSAFTLGTAAPTAGDTAAPTLKKYRKGISDYMTKGGDRTGDHQAAGRRTSDEDKRTRMTLMLEARKISSNENLKLTKFRSLISSGQATDVFEVRSYITRWPDAGANKK